VAAPDGIQVWDISSLPARRAAEEQFARKVAAMPAERQAEAVAERLRELNPGFDGRHSAKVEAGRVVSFSVNSDAVSDITPVRALAGLKELVLSGSTPQKGRVTDLSPLRGTGVTRLSLHETAVEDLSPLAGMRLEFLGIDNSRVSDLSLLAGASVGTLGLGGIPAEDLSALKDVNDLAELYLSADQIARHRGTLKALRASVRLNGRPLREALGPDPK
jgi:hypothetical protein